MAKTPESFGCSECKRVNSESVKTGYHSRNIRTKENGYILLNGGQSGAQPEEIFPSEHKVNG